MRALKALVIGMGILIAAGLAVVVVTIAGRVGDKKPAEATANRPTGSAPIAVPAGATILETDLDSGQIALRLRLADGAMAVFVYDLKSGTRIGRHEMVTGN